MATDTVRKEYPGITLEVFGTPAVTAKPQESVIVKLEELNGRVRLQASVWVDSDRYVGWGKGSSIVFTDAKEAQAFLQAFAAGVEEFSNIPRTITGLDPNRQAPPTATKPGLNGAAMARRLGGAKTVAKKAAPKKIAAPKK